MVAVLLAVSIVLTVILIVLVLRLIKVAPSDTIRDLSGVIQTQVSSTSSTLLQVSEKLGTLSKAAQEITDIGKNIASLQDILSSPKMRGGLGETLLKNLLEQVLPGCYEMPYTFADGKIVDCAILVGKLRVPVDSKFPLDSFARLLEAKEEAERKRARRDFERAVKRHIDAVCTYIRPDEGTMNFAIMYVPAENVYYETIFRSPLFAEERPLYLHALDKRVIPASPTTIFAYLQAIALGLKGLQVEKQAQDILANLQRLTGDLSSFKQGFGLVGKHLGHANNSYQEASSSLQGFEAKLSGIAQRALPKSEKD